MEFKKYVLGLVTVFTISITGMTDAYAETASGATASAGIVTLSGAATSSGAVRKRSNVRTVRTVVSTGSTASGASAAPSTSDPTYVEKNPTDVVTATPSGTASSMEREAGFWAATAIFNAIWIAITLFFGFCLYKIATKLGEPHAWLGFIPYVQTYTFVKCWGKSGWWILWITIGYVAFVIPGLVLTIIVMHGISKRYGRGAGTTALFFFFPYVMLPVLAFSEPSINDGSSPTNVANPAAEAASIPETPAPAIIPTPVSAPILAPSTTVHVQETAPADVNL